MQTLCLCSAVTGNASQAAVCGCHRLISDCYMIEADFWKMVCTVNIFKTLGDRVKWTMQTVWAISSCSTLMADFCPEFRFGWERRVQGLWGIFPWALWFPVLSTVHLHLSVVTSASLFPASPTLHQLLRSLVVVSKVSRMGRWLFWRKCCRQFSPLQESTPFMPPKVSQFGTPWNKMAVSNFWTLRISLRLLQHEHL